jgi:4-hydroxy-tetrahydrodipicolinate synthase
VQIPVKPGSLVALVTPFTESGAIDEPALRALLEWHVESKTDGLVVLGTTGEVGRSLLTKVCAT